MLPSRKSPLLLLTLSAVVSAEPIGIPNFSFELPPVTRDEQNPFGALPFIDDWDETAIGLADEFDQNTGNFLNTDVGQADHITNSHLDRLGFFSSLIGNTVRQELPDTYIPGSSYAFTIAVGKSHTFPVGATEQVQVSLFYFNGGLEQIIASTFVSGSQVSTTSLLDVSVSSPLVGLGDAWAGEQIGVLIRPFTTDPDDEAGEGFWNVDYARLEQTVIPEPATICLLAAGAALLMGRRQGARR